MASTMTCGELKNTTFTKIDSTTGDSTSFGKVSQSSAKKHFNADENNKVYQVRPGARIIKLNNKEQYNSFKQELADRMNIPVDQINSIEDILRDKNSIYDGVMIGPKLQGHVVDPLLKDGGLKIFNEDALAEWGRNTVDGNVEISKDAAFEPMRSGFKAGGTEITDDMRRLSESLYKDLSTYKNAVNSYTIDKYDISSSDVKERYEKLEKLEKKGEYDIGSHLKTISDENFDKKITITTDNTSKATSNELNISAQEIFRVTDICNSLNKNTIDTKTVTSALAMYQHYNGSISNYNQVAATNKLETYLKNTPMDKLNTFLNDMSKYGNISFTTPQNNNELKNLFNNGGNILTGTINNTELVAPYKIITNKTSEDMHREKLIWDKVIQSVKPEHREQFNEIAKVCMANSMHAHVNIKGTQTGSINFGDKKVTFTDGKSQESSGFGSIKTRLRGIKKEVIGKSAYSVNKAIESLNRLKDKLEKKL